MDNERLLRRRVCSPWRKIRARTPVHVRRDQFLRNDRFSRSGCRLIRPYTAHRPVGRVVSSRTKCTECVVHAFRTTPSRTRLTASDTNLLSSIHVAHIQLCSKTRDDFARILTRLRDGDNVISRYISEPRCMISKTINSDYFWLHRILIVVMQFHLGYI